MTGKRMGRPRKPDSEKSATTPISLPPDLTAMLRSYPEGPSATVARLLREEEARLAQLSDPSA